MAVKVVLFGFDPATTSSDRLLQLLRSSMSTRKIHDLETGEPMRVEYVLDFDVAHREKMVWTDGNQLPTMKDVELCIAKGLVKALDKRQVENKYELVVDVQDTGLEDVFDKFVHLINHDAMTGKERNQRYQHVVFVINPNVKRALKLDLERMHATQGMRDREQSHQTILQSRKKARYKYRYNGSQINAPAFSAKGRFVVIDVGAIPMAFGPTEASEGVVVPQMYPSIENDSPDEMLGKIHNMATEAVERVFFPDVTSSKVTPSKMMLVPFFVFKNHGESFHKYEYAGSKHELDVAELVKKMQQIQVPQTNMRVIFGDHSLYDHTHVSMALSRALTTVSDHRLRVASIKDLLRGKKLDILSSSDNDDGTRTFVDGPILLNQLLESSDDLTFDLLSEMGSESGADDLLKAFFGMSHADHKRNLMMRIYPVFVFSTVGKPKHHHLFESYENHFANSGGAVILQSNWTDVEMPFFMNSVNELLHKDTSAVTGDALEALIKGIGNVAPPHIKWNSIHNRTELNYMWSGGGAWSGPFSRKLEKHSADLSENTQENIIRNNLIVLLHQAIVNSQSAFRQMQAFENEIGLTKFSSSLSEDLQSEHAGRMAAARIKVNLKKMQALLSRVSAIFNENHSSNNQLLFDLISELPRLGASLLNDAEHSLDRARSQIQCCKLVTKTMGRDRISWIWIVIVLSGAGGALALLFGPRLMTRRKKRII